MPHELTWTADAAMPGDARRELALGRFQSALGHDLPNQLIALQGLARLLKPDGVQRPDEEMAASLERLALLARKTDVRVRTLADVLRFYREPGPAVALRLEDVAHEAMREVKALFPERAIEYHLQMPMPMPMIHVPRRPLQRAVFHLLANAVEATGEGRAVVRLSGEQMEWAALHIADTGRGLSEAELTRVFTPSPTTPPGPGLGLFLVREALAFWGGALRVRSAPGQGTTVSLLFPRLGAD